MHSTPNPFRVQFTGPLSLHATGLVEELLRLGYASTSATNVMQLAAHLSRWLSEESINLDGMDGEVLSRFLAARRAAYVGHYSLRALRPILCYLRREELAPDIEPAPSPTSRVDILLARFHRYLVGDRGLTVPVADAYRRWVTPFVCDVLDVDSARIGDLSAGDVAGFLTAHVPLMTRKTAQMTACALRSFLRFLHHVGLVDDDLADAVPAVAHRRLSGLPEPLEPGQALALLGACERSTATGRRDYAVITMLYRLGLRCGETAELRLDDVDWRAGVLTVRGKGSRIDRLPLPVDVGDALVSYLRDGRPATTARTVFVKARAPHTPLRYSSLSCIVARAARRAGLGTIHAHRLRHTAASRTINAGASLEDVSHLLRHANPATTAIYAKTDLTRLSTLARPWPAEGGVS